MRSLGEHELGRVLGGATQELRDGRLAQLDRIGPAPLPPAPEPVCYPEPNLCTPDGPEYTP